MDDDNFIIHHEGYTFESYHTQKWYDRSRNKRLRKKLKVNEFLELGIQQDIVIIASVGEELADALLDSIIDISYTDLPLFMGISFMTATKEDLKIRVVWETETNDVPISLVDDEMQKVIKSHGLSNPLVVSSYVDLN